MPDLDALAVFAKVVQSGSFTAAARSLEMPKSTVSQRVAELEARLGVRLLQRTTRTSSLTDAGRVYYDHCLRVLAEIDAAERAVTGMQQQPRGLLRITVPASTQFLGPSLAEFLDAHEGVQLEVTSTDRYLNLVEESFDLAIRAGVLSDSTLIARNLGTLHYVLVASPRYLKMHGRPRTPDALGKHACLVFNVGPQPKVWRLQRGKSTTQVAVKPTLSANDLDMLYDAVIGGVGIAQLPVYRCTDALRTRRLERVLPAWSTAGIPIHAVYPSNRHVSPNVKALLDHLQRKTPAPWAREP